MKVLIVDDEPLARRRLARLIARLPELVLVGEAEDGQQAEQRISKERPDLVLLDIDMPALDGLSLAKRLSKDVCVIFTTAYRQHAVDAFALHAVDYLLKPIEEDRLREAVERVRERLATRRGTEPEATSEARQSSPVRLAARHGGELFMLDPAEVSRFFASEKYAVCEHQGREHVLDESLNELERKLSPFGFFRCHRAELVNLLAVRALHQSEEGAFVELRDGQRAPVSRRALAALKARLLGG